MLNLDLDREDPGHESLSAVAHVGAVEVTKPGFQAWRRGQPARSVVEWWIEYRASLLTRASLSDLLTARQKLRLTVELTGLTILGGVFWTALVLGFLVLVAVII